MLKNTVKNTTMKSRVSHSAFWLSAYIQYHANRTHENYQTCWACADEWKWKPSWRYRACYEFLLHWNIKLYFLQITNNLFDFFMLHFSKFALQNFIFLKPICFNAFFTENSKKQMNRNGCRACGNSTIGFTLSPKRNIGSGWRSKRK